MGKNGAHIWRSQGIGLLAARILVLSVGMGCFTVTAMAEKPRHRRVEAGVVLDLHSAQGRAGLTCIYLALSDLYASVDASAYTTRLHLHVRDSKGDVVLSAVSALDLMKNGHVPAIIGPSTSMEAGFVSELGNKTRVPIISFSATSPSLSHSNNPFFVRATPDDTSQARAIAALAKAFRWRAAVPIYVDTEYGAGLVPFLVDALQSENVRAPHRCAISPTASDDQILEEMYGLMKMQTRVFIVHTTSGLGARIFSKASDAGMMGDGFAWIVTDGVADAVASMDPSDVEASMQGVLGVRGHVPRTTAVADFRKRWRLKFSVDWPNDTAGAHLSIAGLRAYDAAMALAKAVEEVGSAGFHFTKPGNITSGGNSVDLNALALSEAGPRLMEALLRTSFAGLSGNFSLADGQAPSPVLEIVNIIGTTTRRVGFWRPENGLSGELQSAQRRAPHLGPPNFRAVIWPGERTSPPKGWAVPVSGNRLKIGIPMKKGFSEFVRVTNDSNNNTVVAGYCIDVFDAVMGSLEYSVPYDFVPYPLDNGYNDLINQVFLEKFDAVVGDTTILADRSKYVDFTFPFTESGVSMIVPYTDANRKNNAWVFSRPLTWKLWLTSLCFFIFVGFVVWVLEHRINDDFRGPLSHQAGTIFWFSFSTMVFAHREKVVSNLGRFVVIVWVFVVLILTQSYTASLTTMLTVQQLQPTETDIHGLRKRGEFVGYQQGSFVLGLLKQMKFHESKLRTYTSSRELDDALTRGSANGGVAAAIDEVPYLKLFLAKHCPKYTTVQSIYRTAGFGFVFPRGSPLLSDVSRAVLYVREGDTMTKIQAAWLGEANCSTTAPAVGSGSLGLDSFWGLFLIAGVTALFALLAFVGVFVHKNRDLLAGPHESLSQKVAGLARRFNERDLTSHTFRLPRKNACRTPTSDPETGYPSPFGGEPLISAADSTSLSGGTSPAADEHTPDARGTPSM